MCLETFDPKIEIMDASVEELLLYLEDLVPPPE